MRTGLENIYCCNYLLCKAAFSTNPQSEVPQVSTPKFVQILLSDACILYQVTAEDVEKHMNKIEKMKTGSRQRMFTYRGLLQNQLDV